VPWTPPGLMAAFSVDQLNLVLDVIDGGEKDEDGKPTGHYYGGHHNSKPYAAKVIEDHLCCDAKTATRILNLWKEEGVLKAFEYQRPGNRHKSEAVRSDLQKRPGKKGSDDRL
jgi:hypothetical protein